MVDADKVRLNVLSTLDTAPWALVCSFSNRILFQLLFFSAFRVYLPLPLLLKEETMDPVTELCPKPHAGLLGIQIYTALGLGSVSTRKHSLPGLQLSSFAVKEESFAPSTHFSCWRA